MDLKFGLNDTENYSKNIRKGFKKFLNFKEVKEKHRVY